MTGTLPPEIFYALPDLQFIVMGSNAGKSFFCMHVDEWKMSSCSQACEFVVESASKPLDPPAPMHAC